MSDSQEALSFVWKLFIFCVFVFSVMVNVWLWVEYTDEPTIKYEYKNNTEHIYGLDTGDYTIIYKGNRTLEQYSRTMLHEACHEFVRNDNEHYCGVDCDGS